MPVALAFTLTLAVLAHASPAHGGELTLEQAVRGALESFPTVEVARAGADEARAAVAEAGAARWPSLKLSSSGTRYEQPMLVGPIHGFAPSLLPPFDETQYQATTSLVYPLFDGGSRTARIRAARADVNAANAGLDATEQSLTVHVIAAYLDVLGLRQVLGAHDLRLEALQSERYRVSLMRRAGRAAPIDSLRVDAALASAEAERVRTASRLDVAERALARLAGLSFEAVHEARLRTVGQPGPADVPRDTLLAQARLRNPALRQASARLRTAGAGLDAARSQRWPEVRLVGGYNGWIRPDGAPKGEWSASLQMAWSLFDGGATGASIAKARAARRGAEERLRSAGIVLEQDLDLALATCEESRARQASLQAAADRLAEVARIDRLLLESGSGTQTDYLTAEADLLAARSALIDAQDASVAAQAELARVTGRLGFDWISRMTEAHP